MNKVLSVFHDCVVLYSRFALRVRVIPIQPTQSSDIEEVGKSPKVARFGFHGRDGSALLRGSLVTGKKYV